MKLFKFYHTWDTPATKYPLEKIGRAKITRSQLKKGFYWMEGVRGYTSYYVRTPVPVTSFKITVQNARNTILWFWIYGGDAEAHR